jgi:hypothetical protein
MTHPSLRFGRKARRKKPRAIVEKGLDDSDRERYGKPVMLIVS